MITYKSFISCHLSYKQKLQPKIWSGLPLTQSSQNKLGHFKILKTSRWLRVRITQDILTFKKLIMIQDSFDIFLISGHFLFLVFNYI